MSQLNCERCIKFFEINKKKQYRGITTIGYSPEAKDSFDWYKKFEDKDAVDEIILDVLEEHTKEYKKIHPSIDLLTCRWSVFHSYNIQKYLPGGGFKIWHCENSSPEGRSSKRVLVWMIYLNDVPDGGTMFMEQNFTCEAKAGRIVIWPAYWTHTHKSQVSETTSKYLATGWYSYDES